MLQLRRLAYAPFAAESVAFVERSYKYKLTVVRDQIEYKPAVTCGKMEVQDVSQSRLNRQASSVRVGEMCLRVGADDAGPVL